MKLCLLVILEVPPLKPLQQADTNSHVTVNSAKLPNFSPAQRTTGNGVKLGAKEVVPPGKSTAIVIAVLNSQFCRHTYK